MTGNIASPWRRETAAFHARDPSNTRPAVGDYVAMRQTRKRFWWRACGSITRRLSLISFF